MNKNNKYLNSKTIKHELNDECPKGLSVILGMIVLVITLSIVTFTKVNSNDYAYSYNYKFKSYLK